MSVKGCGSLIPIFEGQCSTSKPDRSFEMQAEIDRLKSLLESTNRRADRERHMSRFDAQLENLNAAQEQGAAVGNQAVAMHAGVPNSTDAVDVVRCNFPIPEGMNLNFVPPLISNGISRAVVDKAEVSSLKLS